MPKRLLYLLILLLALPPADAYCQTLRQRQRLIMLRKQRAENIQFAAGGGLSSLMVNGKLLKPTTLGGGGNLDFGYTHFFNLNFGLHTGIGTLYSRSGFHQDRQESSTLTTVTVANNQRQTDRAAHLTTITSDMNEHYNAFYVSIPLQFAYQYDNLWVNFGVRIMLPLSVTASYDYGKTLIGVGYDFDGLGVTLPHLVDKEIIDPQSGTYKVSGLSGGEAGFAFFATASIEGGYRMPMGIDKILYLGVYLDYSLNQVAVGGDENYTRDEDDNLQPAHALSSSIADHLRYASFGIRLTYNYSSGRRINYHKANYRRSYRSW